MPLSIPSGPSVRLPPSGCAPLSAGRPRDSLPDAGQRSLSLAPTGPYGSTATDDAAAPHKWHFFGRLLLPTAGPAHC
eukprot:1037334-Pyramimonas_sp.AAC.1